jgi:sacsin
MSADYYQDPVVLHDLRETYKWLDEHSEEAEEYMIQHNTDKLFLNVADPEVSIWQWCSAEEMLLGIDEKVASFHPVLDFLLPFEKLLAVSGVHKVNSAMLPERLPSNESEISLEAIRLAFCLMREKGQFMDLELVPGTDHDEPRKVFHAHRVYMAACTPYFKCLVPGGFQESPEACEGPVQVDLDGYSAQCVEMVLSKYYELGC